MRLKPYLVVSAALALGFGVPAQAQMQGDATAIVRKAVEALGGASALRAVKTVTMQGTAKHWEPDQSFAPGGEQRFLSDDTMTVALDVATGSARVDWDRAFQYPAVQRERFTEVFADGVGYVHYAEGAPDRAMSGNRLAAEQRELWRGSPVFVLGMLDHPERLHAMARQRIDGSAVDVVGYRQGNHDYVVMFDGSSHLPARVRVRDADSLRGDSDFDLVLGDWTSEGGIKVARAVTRELGGRPVEAIKFEKIAVNPALPADQFAIPAAIKASGVRAATADVPYQWYLRRFYLGRLVDSDAMFYDGAGGGPRVVELGRGVLQVVTGSHNNLIVEMKDHLVVFDAPVNERQSRFVIDLAKTRFPGKPIKYLVLTHHHMDHTSGVRTYMAEGATLIVGSPAKAFFTKVAAAPHMIDKDALQRHPRKVEIREVVDMLKISDGDREVGIYRIDAKHVDGMLIMQVADTKLVFVTDLYSPVRDTKGNPNQSDFIAGLDKWRLTPEIIAGGHGTAGSYADLMKMQSAASAN